MEALIDSMLRKYEEGTVSRRALIGGLAAAATIRPRPATPLQGVGVGHISLQVTSLAKSRDFYHAAFGLEVSNERGLRMGPTGLTLQERGPVGVVDHFQLNLLNFDKDAVTAELKKMGIEPHEDPPGGAGFHVLDPDGYKIQIGGAAGGDQE